MSIYESLQSILASHALPVPRAIIDRGQLEAWAGPLAGASESHWLLPVTHQMNPPAAPAAIQEAETALAETIEGEVLPAAYREFLALYNGAALFAANALWKGEAGATQPRFQLFGTQRLVEVNRELFSYFRDSLGDTPRFADTMKLNFVAIGEAYNYNHVAIVTEGEYAGTLFLLTSEGMARPYAERYADMYPTLAPSFEAWLALIAQSSGWEGYDIGVLFE